MRVYEFSKQYNIPTKDIISILKIAGFDIKSHMSIIDDQAIVLLKKKIDLSKKDSTKKNNSVEKNIEKNNAVKSSQKIATEGSAVSVDAEANSEQQKKKESISLSIIIKEMSVADLAQKLSVPVSDLILTLLRMGVVAEKNKILSENVIKSLSRHYNFEIVSPQPIENITEREYGLLESPEKGVELKERLPIVVILGHVDHGKTTLLDFIRKSRVAAREKGGITQHIGAYEASTKQGNIIFLDTPGHEAFSKMRKRGIRIADIVVLLVAADDGVMPQTIEAAKHALSMKVPIIVAINKMDKVDAVRIEVIKRELSQYGIIPEEWGGDAVCVPISAKTGNGVDALLEMIILQAQLMDLKAAYTGLAQGFVLEAGVEKGYGQVATVISQQGTIHVGDYFAVGNIVGKVVALVDSHGTNLKEAKPSIPVRIAGFESLPNVGDYFECLTKNNYLIRRNKKEQSSFSGYSGIKKEGSFNFIVKTDTNSSKEALLDSIINVSNKTDKGINIVLAHVGAVTESDVQLAYNVGASIIGLHVKVEPNALLLAQQRGVLIYLFDIIYKLLEHLEFLTKKAVEVKKVYTRVGEATVLRVFDIKGIGVIAGSYVKEGRFAIGGHVNVLRNNKKIGEGVIKSLQRDKKSVKEVHTGFECGFVVDGFNEWMPHDIVECLVELPEKSR